VLLEEAEKMKKYFVNQEKMKELFNDGTVFTMENPETLIGIYLYT
jgi:hypothetical protein